MISNRFLLAIILLSATSNLVASSNDTMKEVSKEALEINSEQGLKCDREKMVCEAEGSVVVRKGPYEMHSQKASASMRKNQSGKMEISRVEAHDDVQFFGVSGEKATANSAVYDLDAQQIVLTPEQNKQVVVWKDQYLMLSDRVEIHFKEGSDKKIALNHIDAKGHVQLSSPDELVEGQTATMTPETKTVLIRGDVRVNRKEGELRGPMAEVNLDTKVSKVLNTEQTSNGSNRVSVYVYPKELDNKFK